MPQLMEKRLSWLLGLSPQLPCASSPGEERSRRESSVCPLHWLPQRSPSPGTFPRLAVPTIASLPRGAWMEGAMR